MDSPGQIIAAVIVLAALVWLYQQRQDAPLAARGPAATRTAVVTRSYRGSAREAAEHFQRDAVELARQGYVPVSQIYTPGSWGCGAFLVALILFLVLIGILIFIYMLIVKPAGVLIVTYEYRPANAPPVVVAAAPAPDPAAALAALATMRGQGHITAEEYEAKKAELLGRM